MYIHDLGGQGTGLIQTDDVDARERFDTVHLVDQHLLLRKANDRYCQHARGEQDHAAGDHADQCADDRPAQIGSQYRSGGIQPDRQLLL